MSTAAAIVAPTDAHLDYIASLCFERGWPYPQAIHSKQEASEIIGGILSGTYDATRYLVPTPEDDDVPF